MPLQMRKRKIESISSAVTPAAARVLIEIMAMTPLIDARGARNSSSR